MFGSLSMKFLIILIILTIPVINKTEAAQKNPEVGIQENLGGMLPLDDKFTNSDGRVYSLKQLIDKPTILALVYYHCPGLCSPLLNNVAEVIDRVPLVVGKDYQILTISFDKTETPAVAEKWKKNYFAGLKHPIDSNGWKFMTGDSISIRRLTDSAGFFFKPVSGGDFIHASCIISISPQGKIMRYLFGTKYLPFDFKMAILEANKENPQPTVNRILNFCYSYDPKGRQYTLNFTRIFGGFMLLSLVAFVTIVLILGKKKKLNK